ncbi:MAG: hypothetical protein ABJD11_16610 [Gemmatimonadota bacterium]
MLPDSLASPVWLLAGLGSARAVWLTWDGGMVTCSDADSLVFSVPVQELRHVRFPWYYFGRGLKVRVRATEYRLSFIRPGASSYAIPRMQLAGGAEQPTVVAVRDVVQTVEEGRAAWRSWREKLRGG